jgi:hypothetical protein
MTSSIINTIDITSALNRVIIPIWLVLWYDVPCARARVLLERVRLCAVMGFNGWFGTGRREHLHVGLVRFHLAQLRHLSPHPGSEDLFWLELGTG